MKKTKWINIGILLLLPFVLPAQDPFADFLQSVPVIEKIVSDAQFDSAGVTITTERFVFKSRRQENSVYAIISYPSKKGVYPAILFLHGGNGNAEGLAERLHRFAHNGYVALAIDLPGICHPDKVPYSAGKWKKRTVSEKTARFDVADSAANSTLADGIIAAIEAFNLLATWSNVDKRYMGITGYSWGGYSTTMVASLLGGRVKAAYGVFGCGFYDKGSRWKNLLEKKSAEERNTWLTYLDAGRRAGGMKAAYFIDGASNDNFFWPPAVMATLNAVASYKNHNWAPNYNHKQMPAGDSMQAIYFDYYLKNKGLPFGEIRLAGKEIYRNKYLRLTFKVNNPRGIQKKTAVLYYSRPEEDWTKRQWNAIVMKRRNKVRYTVDVPIGDPTAGNLYYGMFTDNREVSVSSEMFDLNTLQ
jgi:cephalosporin-C deacetylase-like acetyl esterase